MRPRRACFQAWGFAFAIAWLLLGASALAAADGDADPAHGRWAAEKAVACREFTLPAAHFAAVALSMHYDQDVEVYINGALAAKAIGPTASYEPILLRSEALAALRPGRNVLAAHCRQKGGGQYFDLGIDGFSGP
jgi:hypothetical protein